MNRSGSRSLPKTSLCICFLFVTGISAFSQNYGPGYGSVRYANSDLVYHQRGLDAADWNTNSQDRAYYEKLRDENRDDLKKLQENERNYQEELRQEQRDADLERLELQKNMEEDRRQQEKEDRMAQELDAINSQAQQREWQMQAERQRAVAQVQSTPLSTRPNQKSGWQGGKYLPQTPAYFHRVGTMIPNLKDNAVEIKSGDLLYYYQDGNFYTKMALGGYVAMIAPLGVIIPQIPPDSQPIQNLPSGLPIVFANQEVPSGLEPAQYLPSGKYPLYYYWGSFFEFNPNKGNFRVVAAPEGAIVSGLPEGYITETISGKKYYVYNNVYYQVYIANTDIVFQVKHPI